jgi:hypothetical protein
MLGPDNMASGGQYTGQVFIDTLNGRASPIPTDSTQKATSQREHFLVGPTKSERLPHMGSATLNGASSERYYKYIEGILAKEPGITFSSVKTAYYSMMVNDAHADTYDPDRYEALTFSNLLRTGRIYPNAQLVLTNFAYPSRTGRDNMLGELEGRQKRAAERYNLWSQTQRTGSDRAPTAIVKVPTSDIHFKEDGTHLNEKGVVFLAKHLQANMPPCPGGTGNKEHKPSNLQETSRIYLPVVAQAHKLPRRKGGRVRVNMFT